MFPILQSKQSPMISELVNCGWDTPNTHPAPSAAVAVAHSEYLAWSIIAEWANATFPQKIPTTSSSVRAIFHSFEWEVIAETYKPILAKVNSLPMCSACPCTASGCLNHLQWYSKNAVSQPILSIVGKSHFSWETWVFSHQNAWEFFLTSQMQIKHSSSTVSKSYLDSVPHEFGRRNVIPTVTTAWNRIQVNQSPEHNNFCFLTDVKEEGAVWVTVELEGSLHCQPFPVSVTRDFQAKFLRFWACYSGLLLLCILFLQEL